MARTKEDPDRVQIGDLTATPMRDRGERDGRRYWRIRRKSTRETVRTGWWTREEVAAEVALEVRNPTPSRHSAPEGARTVGELLALWVAVQQQRVQGGEIADRSLVNYRQAARHWTSSISDVLASALTREVVEDTLRAWRAGGVGARTCKLAADVMSAATRWGAPRGHCPALDLRRMQAVEVDPEEHVNCETTPTRDESDRVLEEINPGRNRDVVELLGLTGARVGEVAALRVASYDRDRGELVLSGRDRRRSRRGKVRARRFPVVGRLAELLEALTAGRDRAAPLVEGLPRDVSDLVRRELEVACAAAGVERFTAHGLRRMVAMELLEQADARSVAELTGHSPTVLLRDYVRPRPERLRDVVARATAKRGKVLPLRAHGSGTTDESEE